MTNLHKATPVIITVTPEQRRHILLREFNKLWGRNNGAPYAARLSGRGTPLKCKVESCCNPALDNARRQLCPGHYLNYLGRSNLSQAQPRCHSCNVHTKHENTMGVPECLTCQTKRDEENHEREAREREAQQVLRQLDNAETVHELREWIKEYHMPK